MKTLLFSPIMVVLPVWVFACFPRGVLAVAPLPAPQPVVAASYLDSSVYLLANANDYVRVLLRQSIHPRAETASSAQKLEIANWVGPYKLYTLHVANDFVWVSSPDTTGDSGLIPIPLEAFVRKGGTLKTEGWNGLRLGPINSLAVKEAGSAGGGFAPDYSATKTAFHSFALGPGRRMYLFLAWKRELSVWPTTLPVVSKTYEWHPKKITWDNWNGKPGIRPKPKPARKVPTTIQEPFLAYLDKERFYFVTRSGRVYVSAREGKEELPECVWNDPDRPVRLVVEDASTGKAFAFALRTTAARKAKPDVFFLLERDLEPKPVEPPVVGEYSSEWRARLPVQYARFLVREKLLPAPPKEKASAKKE